MPIIKIRITNEEKRAIEKMAKIEKLSVQEIIKKFLFEKLEEEYGIKNAEKGYQEYLKDPVTYTLKEAFEILENE